MQSNKTYHLCLRLKATKSSTSSLYEKGVHGIGYCWFCGEAVFFIPELREKSIDKYIICQICFKSKGS